MAGPPRVTGTTHTLPFERLSPLDFERLCLWLVRREGYQRAEHLGAAGGEQGRDIVAWRDGRRVVFQCKRVKKLDAGMAAKEIDKLANDRPDELVFVVSNAVSATIRKRIREAWGTQGACEFWAGSELDERVKHHEDLVREFFQLPGQGACQLAGWSGVRIVPDRPPHYLERPEYLRPLKTAVLERQGEKLGTTSTRKVGIQGMGGVGKSVLAASLAQDPEVRETFPEVLWVSVGRDPDLVGLLADLAGALGLKGAAYRSHHEGKRELRQACKGRPLLLVLDDIWRLEHASALDVVDAAGCLLITTRNWEEVIALGAYVLSIDVLNSKQARALLANLAGQAGQELPPTAERVAEKCGNLPLALAMVGAMVRIRPTAWEDALYRLESTDLDKIRSRFPDYPYPDLLLALEASVDALPSGQRDRYMDLAVFSDQTAIPEAALEVLWDSAGRDRWATRELIDSYVGRSLARRDSSGRLSLHALQRDYIRQQTNDLEALHRRLVGSYERRCSADFAKGPNDGYFFERITHHLLKAGKGDDLAKLLLDPAWMAAKLQYTNLNALISDLELIEKELDPQIAAALRLASPVLAKSPQQLGPQLVGRLDLSSVEQVQLLVDGFAASIPVPWLRVLSGTLARPGGRLIRSFLGHSEGICDVSVLPDGLVVSTSKDGTLKLWDLEVATASETIEDLEGWGDLPVLALSDSHVVFAAQKGEVRIWNYRTGEQRAAPATHSSWVYSLCRLPSERVASASSDAVVSVWNAKDTNKPIRTFPAQDGMLLGALEDGTLVSSLEVWDVRYRSREGKQIRLIGHTGQINAAAMLFDGRLATASADATLRIWDLDDGRCLKVLRGHRSSVNAVAVLPYGRIVSAGEDYTVRIWDVGTAEVIEKIDGGHDLAVLPDGRLAIKYLTHLRIYAPTRLPMSALTRLRTFGLTRLRTVSRYTWKMVQEVDVNPYGGANWSFRVLDANRVLVLTAKEATLWLLDTGRPLFRTRTDVWEFTAACVFPGAKEIIVVRTDKHVGHGEFQLMDAATGSVQAVQNLQHKVEQIVASEDSKVLMLNSRREFFVTDLQAIRARREPKLVTGLAASPAALLRDGSIITHELSSHGLRFWNPESGETANTLDGLPYKVNSIAQFPPSCLAAAAGATIHLWNLSTREEVFQLEGHTYSVADMCFLPDKKLVSASADKTLRVWDTEEGKCLQVLRGHEERLTAVTCVSPERILSGSEDATLRLWQVGGSAVDLTRGHQGSITGVTFLPDGRLVSVSREGCLCIWRCSGTEEASQIETPLDSFHQLEGVDAMTDGTVVIASSVIICGTLYGGFLNIWSPAEQSWSGLTRAHGYSADSVLAMPDRGLASAGGDHKVKIWRQNSGGLLCSFEADLDSSAVALTLLGDGRLVCAQHNGPLSIFPGGLQGHPAVLAREGYPEALCPLGRSRLLVATYDEPCRLEIWDLEELSKTDDLVQESRVTAVASAGVDLVLVASQDRALRLWSLAERSALTEMTFDATIERIAVRKEDGLVAAGDSTGNVHLIQIRWQ